MKTEEITRENTSVAVTVPQRTLVTITGLTNSDNTPSYNPQFLQTPSHNENESTAKLNFKTGMAAFVLDKIVAETDKHEARERIKVSREEGGAIEQRIRELKKPSAGDMFMNGTCRIG